MIYYNDHDRTVCAWLRELISARLIAPGIVDDRSILDVKPSDLTGFTQCHFFAGIGGWSFALRLAGWPDDEPVWTGSPPCQPFSVAGAGLSRDDPRHLAPHFLKLVRACRPPVLFGEQVASADVFGKVASGARKRAEGPPAWAWFDDVSDRLEAAHYAIGASDFPSAGVGAPHIRQRTFFGAYDLGLAAGGMGQPNSTGRDAGRQGSEAARHGRSPVAASGPGGIHNATGSRQQPEGVWAESQARHETRLRGLEQGRDADRMADSERLERQRWRSGEAVCEPGPVERVERLRDADRMGNGFGAGLEGHAGHGDRGCEPGRIDTIKDGSVAAPGRTGRPAPTNGPWRDADWLYCRDGKWRPVEPGTFPLAHGISGRVGLLRGYGNAINPWAAKAFIEAFVEAAQ